MFRSNKMFRHLFDVVNTKFLSRYIAYIPLSFIHHPNFTIYLPLVVFFSTPDERFNYSDLIKTNFMCPFVCKWQRDKCEAIYQKKKTHLSDVEYEHEARNGKKAQSELTIFSK